MTGGGFITGIVFHPASRGLAHCGTDTGGAYRWDNSQQQWIPPTDWVTSEDSNLLGIEAIALDPSDPSRLYLSAGTYTSPRSSNGFVLRSQHQGKRPIASRCRSRWAATRQAASPETEWPSIPMRQISCCSAVAMTDCGDRKIWDHRGAKWRALVWAPYRSVASYSVDSGRTWKASQGVAGDVVLLSDHIFAIQFYPFDPSNGTLFQNEDMGLSFQSVNKGCLRVEECV